MSQDEQLHDVLVDWNNTKESHVWKETSYKAINPWARFAARMLDTILFTLILAILSVFLFPPILDLGGTVFSIIALFIWVLIESILLATWGSTLGKWLLKIKLDTNEGKKLNLVQAIKRSLKVWFFGMAMGIPFINLFTLISAYSTLTKNRITSWDKAEGCTITHEAPNIYRLIAVWLLFGAYFALLIYARIH